MDENEVWVLLHTKPMEVDPDLALDPSMHGRYRMEQVERWRQEPKQFMYRDIMAMSNTDLVARRRKELIKQMIEKFKEGTNVGEEEEDLV